MATQLVRHGVHMIALGQVNVYLLESQDGLVLIDAGFPKQTEEILDGVREAGKQPADIKHILLTHYHPDHMGSAAALKRETGAQTYAHPIDAPLIRAGGDFDLKKGKPRLMTAAPGLLGKILFRVIIKPYPGMEGTEIDHEINEGETLLFLPDLKIIFAPGHSDGQIAFLLEGDGGLLFAADACVNVFGLGWVAGFENFEEGKRTLKKLCDYDFEVATFGHGKPIMQDAAARWRKKWGNL